MLFLRVECEQYLPFVQGEKSQFFGRKTIKKKAESSKGAKGFVTANPPFYPAGENKSQIIR